MLEAKVASKVVLFVLVVLGLSVGCRRPELTMLPTMLEEAPSPAKQAEPSALPEGWTLQFSDNFNRPELGKDWQIVSGTWSLKEGMLIGGWPGIGGDNSIVCTRKFSGDQRLEFYARSDQPCDLTGQLCVNESGFWDGYFFGFGSDNNAYSKLLIKGRLVVQYDGIITPGKIHHIVCQREGNQLRHIVDGKVIMTFTHEPPLKGERHEMIGFYIWNTGKIDDVKVYTKPEK